MVQKLHKIVMNGLLSIWNEKPSFNCLCFVFSTCASGQWSCSQLDCSRTCSILRNKHYTTFSGEYIKVNGGSCAFTAAKYRDNAKKFSLTLSNIGSTESIHTLQGKLTIDGIEFWMVFF